jgi:hypothetical protein
MHEFMVLNESHKISKFFKGFDLELLFQTWARKPYDRGAEMGFSERELYTSYRLQAFHSDLSQRNCIRLSISFLLKKKIHS